MSALSGAVRPIVDVLVGVVVVGVVVVVTGGGAGHQPRQIRSAWIHGSA